MDSNARATVIAAIIGGFCVCGAAFISLFTPLTGKLVDTVFNNNPTTLPSPVVARSAVPPQTTAPSAPPLTVIVINDSPLLQSIFIDGRVSGGVDTGRYVTFSYPRGKYLLQNCPSGMNPQEHLTSCGSQTQDVETDPFIWYIQGNVTPDTDVTLIARNITQYSYDLFVDNKLETSLDPSRYVIQRLPRGAHTLRACLRGATPSNNPDSCLAASRVDLQVAVFPFDISN